MSVCRECGGDEARANREVDQLTEALRTCRKERDEAREKLTVNAAMGVMAREENLRLRSQLSEARAEVERLREAFKLVFNDAYGVTVESVKEGFDQINRGEFWTLNEDGTRTPSPKLKEHLRRKALLPTPPAPDGTEAK